MEQSMRSQLQADDYVGFWSRVVVSLVDFLVLLLPAYLLNRLFVWLAEHFQSGFPMFVQFVLLGAFNIFMVARYGGTPGKLLLKVRIINGDGERPSVKQAVIRYSLYIVNSFLALIVSLSFGDNFSFASHAGNWGPLAAGLNTFLGFVILIDCLCVAFMKHNRAVHDFMAGTYVVKKSVLELYR